MLKLFIVLLKLLEVRMTKKKDWTPYKAALRRKKIAQDKREKADRYVDEMNKRAELHNATQQK